MRTNFVTVMALLLSASAFAEAVISDRIADGDPGRDPPGFVYTDDRRLENYTFEIHFRLDSEKFDSGQQYSCGSSVPVGYWLFDRWPLDDDSGAWAIAIGGNQSLCFSDRPWYSWGPAWPPHTAEFTDLALDTCHVLTARRSGNQVAVALNGTTKIISELDSKVSYRAGSRGVGVGREVNGYSDRYRYDSFPGEISYVNDDGRVIDFERDGTVTGTAKTGESTCATSSLTAPSPAPASPSM